jgi:hypothetical protein
MNPSKEFFDLLDESPRDSRSVIVHTTDGETRCFPIAAASKAFELRVRQGSGRPALPPAGSREERNRPLGRTTRERGA